MTNIPETESAPSCDGRTMERRNFIRQAMAATPLLAATALIPRSTPAATCPVASTPFFFNVTDPPYCADNTGFSDATGAIQLAINDALAAGGGCVLLPAGTYRVDGSLVVHDPTNTKTIEIRGVTPTPVPPGGLFVGGTMLVVPSGYSGDTISTTSACGLIIRSLTITSTSARTVGNTIYLYATANALIEDVDMNNQFICVKVSGGNNHRVNRGYWKVAPNGYGFWLTGTSSAGDSNDTFLSELNINGGLAGIRIDNTGGAWITDCDCISNTYGLLIFPGNGQRVLYCFFTGLSCDTSAQANMMISTSGNGFVQALTFVNCWCASMQVGSTGSCITVTGTVDGVQFIGHRIFNSVAGNGLWVSGATVKHIYADACVASGMPVGAGFTFVGGTTDFAVRNCHSGAYGGFVGNKYGVFVDTGSTRYVINGCTLTGNTTNNLYDHGSPPSVVVPGSNLIV